MSHPLRVRILAMLRERKSSPRELAELLGATLGTTAYHVRTLERLGLIELVDERPVRGAIEHYYRATTRPGLTGADWSQAPPIARQAAVGSNLQIIDEYARTSAAAGGFDREDAYLERRSVRVDAKGFAALSKACAKLLGATLGTTAYHVRTLERLGLIELVDERPVRGAIEHYYRATTRPGLTGADWSQAPPIARQAAVGSNLQIIDEYARTSAAAGGFDREDAYLERRSVRVDAKGFAALSKACAKLLEQADKIAADSAARLEKEGESGMDAGIGVLLFEAVRLTQAAGEEAPATPKRRRRSPRSSR